MRQHKRQKGAPSQRQLRVGESLRHALAELLLRVDIDDDDLRGVSITVSEVRAAPDLRRATAFVAPLGGQRQNEVVAALNRHQRFVRGELSRKLTLKYMPEISFRLDSSYDAYDHISDLLHSSRVARDLKS